MPCPLALSAVREGANMLGYLCTIRLACPGGHVECGSLLPLFAAWACPGVLLASPGNTNSKQPRDLPIGAFGFM